MTPDFRPLLINTREAAQLLGVCNTTVRKRMREGQLPPVRLGRALRFRLVDVEALAKHEVSA